MTLTWTESPDALRPGARIHHADLFGGSYIVVQEIRVAEAGEPAEWGWIICDPDGYPVHMRNGFMAKDGKAAVDVSKEHVAAFCLETGIGVP